MGLKMIEKFVLIIKKAYLNDVYTPGVKAFPYSIFFIKKAPCKAKSPLFYFTK